MPREIDKFLAPRPGKVTPGIPGHPLPPRPGGKPPPLPKAVEDFEITVESGPPPAQDDRRGASGHEDEPLPVEPESLPRGHVLATDRNWPPAKVPTKVTPPEFESPAVQERAKRELERRGYSVEAAPSSSVAPERPSAPVPASRWDPAWWRTTKGMAIVLPLLVTSVSAVLGGITAAVVIPIVRAVREPLEGAKVKDIAEAKAAGERCDAAVASERRSALAREQELADKLSALDGKLSEIARRVPEVKPDPSRRPLGQ